MTSIANIATVARREFEVRARTRSFLLGTLLLVIGVLAIALLPVIVRVIDRQDATKVAVVVTAEDLTSDPVATLTQLLNTPTGTTPDPQAAPDYTVTRLEDVDAGRRQVIDGRYAALFAIDRAADGELSFTLYSNDTTGRSATLAWQAANSIAVADRLDRLGIAPGDQAGLFAPAQFGVAWPDPERTEPIGDTAALVGQDILAFGMTILIFMMIVMYGTWIAMSVVEEKSSRVMEVVLNAATPFQLMAGKVLGVGSVAFAQYAAVVLSGGLALLFQDAIAAAVLGEGGGASLPEGLSLGMLFAFGLYGVFGFLLYACLFAAAGSLVSRQEDVNTAVMPLTLLSGAGYMIALYASMGTFDIRAGWVILLSLVPFLAPFMMLSRIADGTVQPVEVVLSIVLLVAALGAALWVAARIYRAGVLLYGQRPGVRAVWNLMRSGI
ncbi:MAG TPA: ABC transporter permease [Candidatus Limnocylindrales bacterium]|nr:ABC transporter permease [Candidatus Limnocylindrales bacterium]